MSPVPQERAGGRCLPRLIPPASTSPSPVPWLIVLLKALGEGLQQGCTAGFPSAKATCPLPSRSLMPMCLLTWVSGNSSSSRADGQAHLPAQSLSSPMGPVALPSLRRVPPCVVCRAEGPHCTTAHRPAAALTPPGQPRARFVHIYCNTHRGRRFVLGLGLGFFMLSIWCFKKGNKISLAV